MARIGHRRARRVSLCGVAGFTLVEMMLVVFIIGILAASVTPYLAKSISGNRLRTAARSIVTASRYARSIAVMRQSDVYINFDIPGAAFAVIEAAPVRQDQAADYVAAVKENNAAPEPGARTGESAAEPEKPEPVGGAASLSRKLDGVTIAYVETESGESASDGTTQVAFHRNGRCTPFSVQLTDDRRKSVTVSVDAMGSISLEER